MCTLVLQKQQDKHDISVAGSKLHQLLLTPTQDSDDVHLHNRSNWPLHLLHRKCSDLPISSMYRQILIYIRNEKKKSLVRMRPEVDSSSKKTKFGLFIYTDADLLLSYFFSTVNREKFFKLQFLFSDVLQLVVKPRSRSNLKVKISLIRDMPEQTQYLGHSKSL